MRERYSSHEQTNRTPREILIGVRYNSTIHSAKLEIRDREQILTTQFAIRSCWEGGFGRGEGEGGGGEGGGGVDWPALCRSVARDQQGSTRFRCSQSQGVGVAPGRCGACGAGPARFTARRGGAARVCGRVFVREDWGGGQGGARGAAGGWGGRVRGSPAGRGDCGGRAGRGASGGGHGAGRLAAAARGSLCAMAAPADAA